MTLAISTERWSLNADVFDQLLMALHPDRDRAAVEYERLRERVAGLLRWWGASDVEELTDRTLDRVAQKLEQGTPIAAGAFGGYVRGVARMVFYEAGRRRHRPLADWQLVQQTPAAERTACEHLDQCLTRLNAADRDLVLRYYGAGKAAEVRRRLAIELGITPTALRIRAHRIRERLERVMNATTGAA